MKFLLCATLLLLAVITADAFTKKQLENKVKNLEKSLKQMKNQMDSLSGDNGRRLNRLASRVGQVEQTTSKLDIGDTLFWVGLTTDRWSIQDGEIIKWDRIEFNRGNNYKKKTGGYVAPRAGIYQFSVATHDNNGNGNFWINVNSVPVVWMNGWSTEASPTTAATVNLQLAAGDVVQVVNQLPSSLCATTWCDPGIALPQASWFTGHLLYAL